MQIQQGDGKGDGKSKKYWLKSKYFKEYVKR